MRKVLANMFSVLFHPLVVPVYGLAMLFCDPNFIPYIPLLKVRFLLLAFLILVMVPLAWYLALRKLGYISTPQAERKEERFWAYLVTMVAYGVVYLLARRMRIDTGFAMLFLAGALALAALTLVNFFWKMSAHALGMGALTGGILTLSLLEGVNPVGLYTVFVLLGGCVSSARLELGAHTMGQVVAGYFTGLLAPVAAIAAMSLA